MKSRQADSPSSGRTIPASADRDRNMKKALRTLGGGGGHHYLVSSAGEVVGSSAGAPKASALRGDINGDPRRGSTTVTIAGINLMRAVIQVSSIGGGGVAAAPFVRHIIGDRCEISHYGLFRENPGDAFEWEEATTVMISISIFPVT